MSSSSSTLPWKKVDVALLSEPTNSTQNQHDDASSSKELESAPGEAVAMFFGLEMIRGDEYTVTCDGKLQPCVKQKATDCKLDSNEQVHKSKKRKADASMKDSTDEPPTAPGDNGSSAETEAKKPKKKNKKKKRQKISAQEEETVDNKSMPEETVTAATTTATGANMERLQTCWMMATGGVQLHSQLCTSLLQQDFWTPTPIQAATLAPAILGRRNIVGAAPTGSGKTLAYLLPILQALLVSQTTTPTPLRALILTPTRELALQVSRECQLLLPLDNRSKHQCATLVGGLALAKQARILQQHKPPILVATPGRLWELMASREHAHLTDLSQLQFLVIDEADRMIGQGSFPQLVNILDAIHTANPLDDTTNDESDVENDEEDDDDDRLQSLPGVPGEAKVEMLGNVLERLRQQQQDEDEPESVEMDDYEFEEMQLQQQQRADEENDDVSLPAAPPVHRQTFVYSATLTLPLSASYVAKVTKNNKKRKSKKNVTVDGAIAEILEKARASGQTKVVDLTSSDKRHVLAPPRRDATVKATTKESQSASSSRLPPGLSLHKIECTQRHKDSHLYAFLVTTAQGASGPCLVFCNSIAAVRRVGATLQMLRLPVRMLHANMAQKARLKAVEFLREPRSIVVATDVAARGLDIPSVATVVHYDVARQVDTFIHRAGRTARGMGKDAVGTSLSLVAPGEDKAHNKVCEALESKHLFEEVNMDGRLLAAAQERANLAAKVVECDKVETKAQKNNKWFQEAAEEAGLELDEDMLDEGLAGGDRRDQHKLREAKTARERLRQLLAQPMQTQRFGKFLSSNSAAAEPEVAAYVVPLSNDHKKKKKKKKTKRQTT